MVFATMWHKIVLLWALHFLLPTSGLNFINLPQPKQILDKGNVKIEKVKTFPITNTSLATTRDGRRHNARRTDDEALKKILEEHDKNLKTKISVLVQQTIHDTTKKIENIQRIKTMHRENPSYRVGFLISMIKKSKDVVNELFSVGVKHKDDWKALEQMKTYELLVHANVDTANLYKQLSEISNTGKEVQPVKKAK